MIFIIYDRYARHISVVNEGYTGHMLEVIFLSKKSGLLRQVLMRIMLLY